MVPVRFNVDGALIDCNCFEKIQHVSLGSMFFGKLLRIRDFAFDLNRSRSAWIIDRLHRSI